MIPWRVTSKSDQAGIGTGGFRIEISKASAGNSARATRGNRGSSRAAAVAACRTFCQSGCVKSICPIQPRNSPCFHKVTNAACGTRRFGVSSSSATRQAGALATAVAIARRDQASSWRCSAGVTGACIETPPPGWSAGPGRNRRCPAGHLRGASDSTCRWPRRRPFRPGPAVRRR